MPVKSYIKTAVRVHDRRKAVLARAEKLIEEAIHKTAFHVATNAARSMTHDSTNNPSKPGTPPGVLTGTLRSSIDVESFRDGTGTFVARVGTNVEYGRTHELGDPSRNIPARPFLRPAFHKEGLREGGYDRNGRFGKRFAKAINRALRG
jgi:phage gpG-like protein